jgi:hypothetical protein
MGHITTRDFGFHWARTSSTSKAKQRAGASWLERALATIVARLEADTPPLTTATGPGPQLSSPLLPRAPI